MRPLALFVLLGLAASVSSCSYVTEFVIVNASESPSIIRYKIKTYPGPFSPPGPPSSIHTSDMRFKGGSAWNKLTPDRIQLDEAQRTVIVTVNPHEALLIARMHHYVSHDNAWDSQEFPIEEIAVSGSHGEFSTAGDQARRSFSKVSVGLYTLTYE